MCFSTILKQPIKTSQGSLSKMKVCQIKTTAILIFLLLMTSTALLLQMLMQSRAVEKESTKRREDPEFDRAIEEFQRRADFLQTSLLLAQDGIEELSCHLRKTGTRGGFCLTTEALGVGGNWKWDFDLSVALENLFADQSVGDFGAGLGWYGRFFLRIAKRVLRNDASKIEDENFLKNETVMAALRKPKRIWKWKGFDGAVFVHQMTGGLVQFTDLSEPIRWKEKFDWVMSLEVGEHIPSMYQNNFIDNLVRHACKGLVLSWAVPGQGGHNHVNEKDNNSVKEELKSRGFQSDDEWEKVLRKAANFTWFKNTIMVFRRIKDPSDDSLCRKLNSDRVFS